MPIYDLQGTLFNHCYLAGLNRNNEKKFYADPIIINNNESACQRNPYCKQMDD